MANNGHNSMAGIEQGLLNATKSIEDAEEVMSRTKATVEKAKASKDGRNKVVSKASEIVNALLEPASQVANLLNSLGGFFAPCGVAGNVLQGIVDLESGRRENDARIGLIFMDMATTLVVLGTLKPGFENTQTLVTPLSNLVNRICDTMKSFGQFSEAFYEAKALKSKLKHLLHAKGNKEKLTEFHDQFITHKRDFTMLLSQQTVLITSSNATSLKRIEGKIDKVYGFFASLNDEKEDQSIAFVERCGGEENVKGDDGLLDKLASKVGESLTPNVRRAVKESAEEIFKQSSASFNLKFQFAIEQRVEESTDAILKELKSGPYELISDPDIKEIWKTTAAKESSVKRRQFIDAMVYYFHVQWKMYKVDRKADREDVWTKSIISKVYYHPAIGDAIDDDASGYISVEEINEFLRRKPDAWTVPQWVAYWAFGWDADNIFYQEKIEKTYKQLESLRDKSGPNTERIRHYLDETEKPIQTIALSVYTMSELDATAETKMNKLRLEWRTQMESTIKNRLKEVNYRIEYTSMSAICGSERIETTFLPLVALILARHVHMLSQATVSDEDVEDAISAIETLLEVVHDRIDNLRVIWRRQRTDVDVQIRYYANGLLQDYYKANLSDFQTDSGNEDLSSWGSEDEWGSEDDADKDAAAEVVHPATPDVQPPPSLPAQTRSLSSHTENTYETSTRNSDRDVFDQSDRFRAEPQLRNKESDDEENEGQLSPSYRGQEDSGPESDPAERVAPPDSDEESENAHQDEQDDERGQEGANEDEDEPMNSDDE